MPHIHIEFAEYKAVIAIENSEVLEGNFPNNKLKLVLAWIEIHKDELMANWNLAIEGNSIFKIEALK